MSNDPVLIAYAAKRSKTGKRTVWTRIGHAYPHDVGSGLTVVLDAMPLDGRIVLLELDDADARRLNKEAAMFQGSRSAGTGRARPLEQPPRPTKG
jgi:hypothetical protein